MQRFAGNERNLVVKQSVGSFLMWAVLLVGSSYGGQSPDLTQTVLMRGDFYVSPHGNDSWSGTSPEPNGGKTDGPFATLTRARDAVRELKPRDQKRDITVLLRGGLYPLTDTVLFDLRDSRQKGKTIFAACANEQPVFCSGVTIRNWSKLEDPPAALPEVSRGKVWVADLPETREGRWRFYSLYEGDRRLSRSRSAGFNPTRRAQHDPGTTLHFPKGLLRNWDNLEDVELLHIPYQSMMNILPIESVDEHHSIALLGVRTTTGNIGRTSRTPFNSWVENALEFLDEPGEWVLNTRQGKLYLWPPDDEPGDILAPRLIEYIRVEGDVDFDGPVDEPVRNLVFKGLTFTRGKRFNRTKEDVYTGLQHDWAFYDKAGGLFRLRGAEDCVIEECRFYNSGGDAIRLDLHCQRNRIEGNTIHNVGGTGILLCGYGPGTKDVSKHNEVLNNWIHHVGELYWGSTAITLYQSGENRVAHNLIHNVPSKGLILTGNRSFGLTRETAGAIRWHEIEKVAGPWKAKWIQEYSMRRSPVAKRARHVMIYPEHTMQFLHARKNVVEYNDLFKILELTGDGNAFNITACGPGNIIRRNFFHDILASGHLTTMRCDGYQIETVFAENVIYRCVYSGIGYQGRNHCEHNIIADIFETNPFGMNWHATSYFWVMHGVDMNPKDARVRGNIFYSSNPRASFYFDERNTWADIRDLDVDYNLFYTAGDPSFSEKYLQDMQAQGIDRRSISADPLFVDIENGDLRLRPESPAYKLGFREIDLDNVGLEPYYRDKLLGTKLMQTRISPRTRRLDPGKPTVVTIRVDTENAEIRYTLDNTEPTEKSTLYTGTITLREKRAFIRAKAFKEGWHDVYGASEFFLSGHPIDDDFEDVALYGQPLTCERSEDREGGAIFVTNEDPASGVHCLEMTDVPGSKHRTYPWIHYGDPLEKDEGVARCTFDVKLQPGAGMQHRWSHGGPNMELRDGKLWIRKKPVADVPVDCWIHVKVEAGLGEKADGTWNLEVTPRGGSTIRRDGLKYESRFGELERLSFNAVSDVEASFYLDNIKLEINRE